MRTDNRASRCKRTLVGLTATLGAVAGLVAGCGRGPSGSDTAVTVVSAAVIQPQVASFSVPAGVDFKALAAAASSSLTVSDRAQLQKVTPTILAPSTSTGATTSTYGSQVKVGDVTSLAAVTFGASATVAGSVTSGGNVSGAPAGTPVNANQALAASTYRWTVPFNTSTTPVTVNSGTQTLAPGSYGNVLVNGGTLVMNPGTYYIDNLTLNSSTNLTLNNTSAPIFIYVKTTLAFRTRVTGLAENLMLVYFGTNAAALETTFKGTVVAPNATIRLGVGGTPHVGAVFAKSVILDPDVKLTQTPFFHWDLVPFDVGVAPTLNCVVQLDASTYGAVFGYTNTTGANVTLGAGPHNFFSPGQADLGQPILFLPGQVPIASFQKFAAGSTLSLTIGSQSVTASQSSPACSADLGAALTQLYVETDASRAVRQQIAALLGNARFIHFVGAIRAATGPQTSAFELSELDALDLLTANADLLADPATLTADQQARFPGFRSAVLANPAVQRLRLAGDALKGDGAARGCDTVSLINKSTTLRPLLAAQPESVFAQTLALTGSDSMTALRTAVGNVAKGTQSSALLAAPGLLLSGLLSETTLSTLQLAGPVPTGLLGAILGGIGGAIVGAITGGPAGAVAGAIAGALIGGLTEDQVAKNNHPCNTNDDCFGGAVCAAGWCYTFTGISWSFLTGTSCPNGGSLCAPDGSCVGSSRCAQGCCIDQTIIVSLCPGNGCTSDADCSGGNTCQEGCCAGVCGVNGIACNDVVAPGCGLENGPTTCPTDSDCVKGCCTAPIVTVK